MLLWHAYFQSYWQVVSAGKEAKQNEAKRSKKNVSTTAGFEPARAKHNGLAIHRLNHSATLSLYSCSTTEIINTQSTQHHTYQFHERTFNSKKHSEIRLGWERAKQNNTTDKE